MVETKKEVSSGTVTTGDLQSKIEKVTLSFLGFLESKLEHHGLLTAAEIHALNDSIRTMHHLKKMNETQETITPAWTESEIRISGLTGDDREASLIRLSGETVVKLCELHPTKEELELFIKRVIPRVY